MIPKPGDRFRQFQVLSKAGEGGMGVVFRARDTRLDRDVALKFLTHVGALGAREAGRFRLEARSLAALNHANIVTIYDIDEVDGTPFIVMEWVSGTSLGRSTEPMDEQRFLGVAVPVAEALAAAHVREIVHRDVKPDNVLITDDGGVKLVDFGLAKFRHETSDVTKPGTVVGTLTYMSPEQATGDDIGPASDVFSFGVMAYELLAGRRPFDADYAQAVLYALVHMPHEPLSTLRPELSEAVTSIVERCLQKRPDDRYASGVELARDLHDATRATRTVPVAASADVDARGVSESPSSPEIRYCITEDGASIAYAVSGRGPALVRVLGWFTHVEIEWAWPALRLMWELLGENHTVVRYDGRGIGLSSPWTGDFTEETRRLDLDAVVSAIGTDRVVLYGISEGGWTAAHYAAAHAERVSHLIINGSYARGACHRPGYDPEEEEALLTLMRKGWGRDTPQYRQIFTTAYFGPDADPGLVVHFNSMQRAAADGDTAARYQRSLNARGDAQELFARIQSPTLVIHCQQDQIMPFEEGRRIASIVPGARFLPLPTGTHYFPVDDEITHRIVEAINRFTGA